MTVRCRLSLLALVCLASACQSPFLVFAGGELSGEPANTGSFAFADQYATLQLEVNPPDPYSVILRTTVIDGELYIDAADRRRWAAYLEKDPQVRIKLGGHIYRAVAIPVDDTSITAGFLPGRTVYRLDPSGNDDCQHNQRHREGTKTRGHYVNQEKHAHKGQRIFPLRVIQR